MPPSTVIVLSIRVLSGRSVASSSTLVPCVLLSGSPVSLYSLPLALPWISFTLPMYWLGLSAITLGASMIRVNTSWSLTLRMRIPWHGRILSASLVVVVMSLVVGRDRANNAAQFLCSKLVRRAGKLNETVPISSTLPPLLVSNPRGALHVGQY